MSVQLPRLLDRSMQETARLRPSHVSITLDIEPLSTAEIRLPDTEPEVSVGDMIELYVPGRSAGVFRVAGVERDEVEGMRTLRMEHGLVTLGDAIVPGRHEFFGWDNGDPSTTITGYRVCQDRYNISTWYCCRMTFSNRDGSSVNLLLKHGQVVPVITLTDQGWRVPVSQQLIDAALDVNGTWDGHAAAGLINSDHLAPCTPYSHAEGVISRSCDTYRKPFEYSNGFSREGRVTAGTPVQVHAESIDANGNAFLAVSYVNSYDQEIVTFVSKACVQLRDGYIVGTAHEGSGSHIAEVAQTLMAEAHKQDTGWSFGVSDFDEAFGYAFEDANLLKALLSLSLRLREPYMWEPDQSTVPWRLNLRRLDSDDLAELRLSRNITSLSVTVETTNLVTCVLPIGRNGLTVESVNQGERFVTSDDVAQTWHIESILRTDDTTPEALYESALAYLHDHSQPAVSIAISALDLSASTGEPLDALRLGKMCRVPLPEHGITVTETITRLHWPDVYGMPECVEVMLANQPDTVSSMLAYLLRK